MVKAKKDLGQNFLTDEDVLKQIVESANLSKEDTVIEIGPGTGALTRHLIEKAGQVISVEIDTDLLPQLKHKFGHKPNFTLIHGDALKFAPPKTPYKIVANIPYYITSPIINHFLLEQFTQGNPPKILVIMVQKEVAEKIVAKKEKHSVLSLQVHLFGEPELVCIVPKTAFIPMPKVDSAVIKITVDKTPKINADLKKIMWTIHMAFKQKRKKLCNNLSAMFRKEPVEIKELLKSLNIDQDIRAEDLKIEEWSRLINAIDVPR